MEEHAAANRYKHLLERLVSDDPNGAEFIGNGLVGGARRKTKRKATKRKATKRRMSAPIGGKYRKSKKMSRKSKKMSRKSKKMSKKLMKKGGKLTKCKKQKREDIAKIKKLMVEQMKEIENKKKEIENIKKVIEGYKLFLSDAQKKKCPTKKYNYKKPKSTKGQSALMEFNKILREVKAKNPNITIEDARADAKEIFDSRKTKAAGLYYY